MGISFSVVMPLYNKGAYVRRAVLSVLGQSYGDLELIVVDDGSTDAGVEVVRAISDERLRLIEQGNQGVSSARNTGIAQAKGNYIGFLDADDEWHPDFLKEVHALINKYPGAGIYGTNHCFSFPSGRKSVNTLAGLFTNDATDGRIADYFGAFYKYSRSPFSNSGCCIPREVLMAVGGYKAGVKLTEDSDLWCRIALSYSVVFTRKPLCTYYLGTPNSTIHCFEPRDYEVSAMLQQRLDGGSVPRIHVRSVQKAIAHFQLSLAKRASLRSHKKFVVRLLWKRRVFAFYPVQVIALLVGLVFPTALVRIIGRLKTRLLPH